MDSDIKIGVIGGDLRQLAAAIELAAEGYETAIYGFDEYRGVLGSVTKCVSLEDAIRGADFVILPLPVSIDKIHLNTPLSSGEIHLDYVFSLFKSGQVLIGGKFDPISSMLAQEKNIRFKDYYLREELAILNAVPTAEGAINIAMQELTSTLSNMKTLVLGFGRIGKVLSHRLKALNADVHVAARRHEDFAWIEAYGYKGVEYREMNKKLHTYGLIFNTVPFVILNRERLELVHSDAVIIDLASNPGGVDFNAAKDLSLNVIWALSLPGKYAPTSSGKTLKNIISIIMQEEGLK